MSDKHLLDTMRFMYSEEPNEVEGVFNASALYWKDYLYRLIFGAFDFNNIPDTWDKDYMLNHLFRDGMFCITDTQMGVLPLQCGTFGLNVFDRPSQVNVVNHLLGSLQRTIGDDCALIRLQYNYYGIDRQVQRTATMLAMCDSSIAVNLMNSKVAFIGFADDKTQAATMQKMYDMISEGKPAVFIKRSQVQKSDIFYNRVKENFVADTIQVTQRKIIDQFLTSIGINNANTDKKERMIRAEAESNDVEVQASVEHWLETVNTGLREANKLYNMEIEFVRKHFNVEMPATMKEDIEIDEV